MELQTMIAAMTERNLCTYFTLTLLGLSEHSFGENNFINSYMSRDGKTIYVQVKDFDRIPFQNKEGGTLLVSTSDSKYISYQFPELWDKDIQCFLRGKYSLMTDSAKSTIIAYSGLQNKQPGNGGKYTDFRLIALSRNPILKQVWRDHLYDENDRRCILDEDPDIELLEAPRDCTFFNEEIKYTETL